MGWLSGYGYRVKIPCSYTTAGAQTNYTVKITILSGAGTNTTGNIYLQNHGLNWPNDIRFTSSDGSTQLDFYREEYDSTDGTWWVELDSIASSGNTDFYLYYGNASSTDASSGPSTFVHFDDFETGNFSRWDSVDTNSWTVQSTSKAEGTYAAKSVYAATNRQLSKDISPGQSVVIHQHVMVSSVSWAYVPVFLFTSASHTLYALAMISYKFQYYNGSYTDLPTSTVYANDTWYTVDVAIDNSNQLFRWWVNGVSKGSATLKDQSGNTIATDDFLSKSRACGDSSSGGVGYLDQYWVRKYAYPEPAWASPNSEEVYSGTSIPVFMMQYRQRWR